MAQYSTKFLEYTLNAQPTGWTKRWNTSSTIEVRSVLGTIALRETHSGDADAILSWGTVGTPTNVEVLVKMRTSARDWYQNGIYVRGSGGSGSKNGYYFQMFENGSGDSGLVIEKWVSNSYSAISGETISWSADTWYWVRFQVSGSTLRAKIWEDGSSEPGSWTITGSDSSISSGGWVGLGSYEPNGIRYFDELAVATGGDTAVVEPHAYELIVDDLASESELDAVELEYDPPVEPVQLKSYLYGGWGVGIVGVTYYGQTTTTLGVELEEVNDLTSETELDSVEFTQKHLPEIDFLVSEPELDNVDLTQKQTLSVDNLASTTELDSVDIVINYTLSVNDVVSETTLDNITLSTLGIISPNDSTSTTELDSVTLTQKQIISVDDLTATTELDGVELTEAKTLTVNDLASDTSLDSLSLVQEHILAIQDIIAQTSLDNIDLTQKHTLSVEDTTSSTELDNAILTTQTEVQSLFSTTALDSVTLVQHYTISVADVIAVTELDATEIVKFQPTIDKYSGVATIERAHPMGEKPRVHMGASVRRDSINPASVTQKPTAPSVRPDDKPL